MMDSSRIAILEESVRRIEYYNIRITALEEKIKFLEESK